MRNSPTDRSITRGVSTDEMAERMHLAVKTGDVGQVKNLLALGVDVNSRCMVDHSSRSFTFLHVAAYYGHEQVARVLLANGADVNADAADQQYKGTPLHVALGLGHISVAEVLINAGANVNARGSTRGDDCTPLHIAVDRKFKTVVELLISRGAKSLAACNIRGAPGITPRMLALLSSHKDICRLLVTYPPGVDPTMRQHIEKLESYDPLERAVGAIRLRELGNSAIPAVPFLIPLLGDRRSLTQYGPRGERLNSTSPSSEAVDTLGAIGKPAVEALMTALREESGEVKAWAAWVLGNIKDPRAIPSLISALVPISKDRNFQLEYTARTALKKITEKDLGPDPAAWQAWWELNKSSYLAQ